MTDFRRLVLFVTIGSFSVAALLGVMALLSGGDFGETQVRVLLTTLLVGITSVAVLCYLATAGTRFRLVGLAGAASALPTLLLGLTLVWADLDSGDDHIWKAFGIGSTISASLAQVCLLLVLTGAAPVYVRRLLVATLAAVAWVAVHLSGLILAEGDGETARLFGIVAILDVLGTVSVAALTKFGSAPGSTPRLEVPTDLVPGLVAQAERDGQTPEELLRSLLRSDVGTTSSGSTTP